MCPDELEAVIPHIAIILLFTATFVRPVRPVAGRSAA
jgi:hypothetical protein